MSAPLSSIKVYYLSLKCDLFRYSPSMHFGVVFLLRLFHKNVNLIAESCGFSMFVLLQSDYSEFKFLCFKPEVVLVKVLSFIIKFPIEL